ncbi:hypothetical protein RHGRI_018214 [Rhododendron griersonianum]|uniref:Uncharacterized protein n=1 Tax=Rhododendron griersonianum TaxID=479676 RepID=A0AAV6K0T1_9ERIC|nr:hypothetical protein RHGRI_018214 [Rhododendron griersonianum]
MVRSPHRSCFSSHPTCVPVCRSCAWQTVLMGFYFVVPGIRLLLASCAHRGREGWSAILNAGFFSSRRLLLL